MLKVKIISNIINLICIINQIINHVYNIASLFTINKLRITSILLYSIRITQATNNVYVISIHSIPYVSVFRFVISSTTWHREKIRIFVEFWFKVLIFCGFIFSWINGSAKYNLCIISQYSQNLLHNAIYRFTYLYCTCPDRKLSLFFCRSSS